MRTAIRAFRWRIADPPNAELISRLSKETNVPEPIARVLLNHGIDDYDKAKLYFRPSLEQLHDPFLPGGMEKAVARILRALDGRESILVFGDYDVDGTNSAARLYLFLKHLGGAVQFYIPDRIKEGYGISRQGIDRALDIGVQVFLAVDCGITAVEQVDYANSRGLDVIICDHHETGATLPKAHPVLDPITPGDAYPFKSLCGCGVGFKLMQGVARRLGQEEDVWR